MMLRDTPRWRVILRLDIDEENGRGIPYGFMTGDKRETFIRMRFLLGITVEATRGAQFRVTHRRTLRGWHLKVWSDRVRLSPRETAGVQALLGSDWRREAFTIVRASALPVAPPFWRFSHRYNTLYRSHDRGRVGEVTINRGDFPAPPKDGGRFQDRPALGVDILGDADGTVLTIRGVRQLELPDRTRRQGKRHAVVCTVEEYPDNAFWLNNTDVNTMLDAYGNDEKAWIGQRVPVVRAENPNPRKGGVPAPALHVAPITEWDTMFADFASATQGAPQGSAEPRGVLTRGQQQQQQ